MIATLIEKWFSIKISAKKIRKYMTGKMPEGISRSGGGSVVSCVQRRIRPVKNIYRFADTLYGFALKASEEKSAILIFPEYNFFDLFGLIPGFRLIDRYLNRKAQSRKVDDESAEDVMYGFFSSILSGVAEPVEAGITEIVSNLAKGFGMYVYTGSCIVKRDGGLYNAGFLFGPDGGCLGMQEKLHTMDFEQDMGVRKGDKLKSFSLPFGNIAFPICMDATYFETFHIAARIGADLVALPIANMEEYGMWKALRGIWARVQEAYVYGLKSSLNGWIAGMHFTGRAGVFAPLELTPNCDGIIAIAPEPEGDYLISASVDPGRLYEARRNAQYHGDMNPDFEKGYADKTYVP